MLMTPVRRSIYALPLALGLSVSVEASAQPPAAAKPVGDRVCVASATVIAIRVVDANGAAIDPVRVTLRRLRDGKALPDAIRMRAGHADFQLLEADALAWVAPAGDAIEIEAVAGEKRARVQITVGRDASGCGIVRTAGPGIVVLR